MVTNSLKRRLALTVVLIGLVVALGLIVVEPRTRSHARPVVTGSKILLVSQADQSSARLASAIDNLSKAGFTVTETADPTSAFAPVPNGQVAVFFVTRGAFGQVSPSTWASLYAQHTVIGGLDVSLHELQPLAIPGSVAGQGRLRYTSSRAIFSLMYNAPNCASGAMSDWLDDWDVGKIAQQRMLDVANPLAHGGTCTAVVSSNAGAGRLYGARVYDSATGR
jgi:hypothetical protein